MIEVKDSILWNDWHVVARTQDLQKSKVMSVRLLGEDLVLWRNADQLMAWQDLCPHRGARLSLGSVEGDTLVCPYHGWTFNKDGQCVRVPAHPTQPPPSKASIRTYQIQERYGLIWVCLGEATQDVPPFPEWDDPTFRKFFGGPYHYRSSAQRVVENFIDAAHLPILHQEILGFPNHAVIEDYQVDCASLDGLTFAYGVWQPASQGKESGNSLILNVHSFRIFRPLTAYFQRGPADYRFSIFYTITPVEEVECLGWMWMVMNFAHEVPEAEMRAFQDRVVYQDIAIVESQRPQRLPLDLQAELHVPCDRASIAYRKWLKQLGITYGVCY